MGLARIFTALVLVACLCGPAAAVLPRELLGYEEGSVRSVRCKGGGWFTGLEAAFVSLDGFSERVMTGLRLRCSTASLELQYRGTVPDSFEFGAGGFAGGGTVLRADCPKGSGIAGVTWRRGEKRGKDDQAWRPGGLQLYCGTETMNPITLDPNVGKSYPLAGVTCSATRKPPPPAAQRHVTEFEVWQEVDWVGLRIIACEGVGVPAA